MQRSRRALQQRRALERSLTGKNRFRLRLLSVSLIFVSWVIVFLLSSRFNGGDAYVDGYIIPSISTSMWNADRLDDTKNLNSIEKNPPKDHASLQPGGSSDTDGAENEGSYDGLLAREENTNDALSLEQPEVNSGSVMNSENNPLRTERLFRVTLPGFDEFKSKALGSKSKSGTSQAGGLTHRVEPGGKEYNYASVSKGAKILAFNKEANGAANILGRDKDKYLRNPCSVDEKFVVIELSEETLVDTIEMANFEHHSSSLKDFELLGSLVYPTDVWANLGNFTAANVKQAQRFTLQDPKWVRYLRMNFLTHYGSEFYCTLSVIEVYGVDAVERMLEDLISVPDNLFASHEGNVEQKHISSQLASKKDEDIYQDLYKKIEADSSAENPKVKPENFNGNAANAVEEIRHQQSGRMPGDTALKVLMQKVCSLDLSLSVLERYLEEINSIYGSIFRDFDSDLHDKDILIEKIRLDLKNLLENQQVIANDVADLLIWKSSVSTQLDALLKDNFLLRSTIEMIRENQASMENKGMVIFLICLIFGFLAFMRLLVDMLRRMYFLFIVEDTKTSGKFCFMSPSWILLLSCSIIMLILAL
ncbi:hypothetical protein K2173_009075 [Erythroxylum novogranatense]|uniref:SUN domain-containing protein n=1 Tax=Erythroxylum novogranatense TaxID=1862640 RepID=A0AAV8TTA8_9ROSI|nr:hypothetical protein K2173_009075 [Erythroxylum novogranatense]